MGTEYVTCQGSRRVVENIHFREDGSTYKKKRHTRKIEFILYNVPSFTGVIKNAPYYRHIEMTAVGYANRYLKGQYKIGRVREDYNKCVEGYKCKMLILPVWVTTDTKQEEKTFWIDALE